VDNERIREICLALPHTAETLNWGHVLVYWVGDRAIGGKMFALTNADGGRTSFSRSIAEPSAITSCWRTRESVLRRIYSERFGLRWSGGMRSGHARLKRNSTAPMR
jgi:hypothetical protein